MKLIIYGIGDFAELMAHYFTSDSPYEVVAFCADKEYITVHKFNDLPVVSFEDVEDRFPPQEYDIFVAVGYKNMRRRQNMYECVKEKGYQCASYISSKSMHNMTNSIGENCTLLQGAIMEPYASIDNNSFVNTGAILCHHVLISKHCFVAAGSLVGGYTIVKENSFIGFNATILQKLILNKETIVGANTLVVSDTDAHCKYVGSPAKKISIHMYNGIEILD